MEIDSLKLTPRRRLYLEKIKLDSIEKIVSFLPRKYEDLTPSVIVPFLGESKVIIVGKIASQSKLTRIRSKLSKIEFYLEENNDLFKVIIFNREFLSNLLLEGKVIKVSGKMNYYKKEIVASNIYFDIDENVLTYYKLEDGMHDKEFKSIVNQAFEKISSNLNIIPMEFIKRYRLLDKKECLRLAHNPKNMEDIKKAYRHLKYEELLELATSLEINRSIFKDSKVINKKTVNDLKVNEFINSLPYSLTPSQRQTIDDILKDMKSPSLMYRILQGDVGSGKTIVALTAMVAAYYCGFQSSLMAPTDLLARQHFQNITKLTKNLTLNISLLVSDMPLKEKKQVKDDLKDGKIDILVGTHSLIQKDVFFNKLGLVIIDEQHRFGVEQRKLLKEKGSNVDLLLMSATPIPRSLAQTIYGDLDISTLEGFPSGERKVSTFLHRFKRKESIYKIVEKNIEKNKKTFIVCPLIEGNSEKDVLSIYEEYKLHFGEEKVVMLHGKMDEFEKISALESFEKGAKKILVSTTVIEVGIDIKDASLMIIYGSNHFGMAQLHQLRGRIGRDGKSSECYLLYDGDDEEIIERLNFFASCNDGFEISRYDMQKRGIGDIIGTRQSGISELKNANIIDDYHILEIARKDVKEMFKSIDNREYSDYIMNVRSKMNENMAILN